MYLIHSARPSGPPLSEAASKTMSRSVSVAPVPQLSAQSMKLYAPPSGSQESVKTPSTVESAAIAARHAVSSLRPYSFRPLMLPASSSC